ncbi:MAG: DedA family protein [Synergistales bacterium]|nr:DedA family protein [Synergistales bacterium]
MMEDLLFHSGYLGLFGVSFLAATLVPLGSEIFVALMTVSGYEPLLIFTVATTGNTLGSITNYYVGKLGRNFLLSPYINFGSEKLQKAEKMYRKWGAPILSLAWIPIVGDPLTVIAGVFNLDLPIFTFWVFLGKSFRYSLVIMTAETFLQSI